MSDADSPHCWATIPSRAQQGTVRTWPPFPTRSTIAQCRSRIWTSSFLRDTSSARRSPHPSRMEIIVTSRVQRRLSPTLNVCTDMGHQVWELLARLQSLSPSGFPERISVTPIRRNPPCNSFSTCRNMELVLRWVFGNGLQEASVAPAGTFLRPKSPALLASRATRRATALEKWLSPWYSTGIPPTTPK